MAKRRGGKPKGALKDLPIDQVVRLPELQCRALPGGALFDPAHAAVLAAVVRDPRARKLPRVQVRLVEGMGYLLTDGFDTVEGHLLAGRRTVPANVFKGTWHDAVADAAGANAQHDKSGRPRTRADKRRAVETVLGRFDWSDVLVAEHCGVSRQFVGDVRGDLPPAAAQPVNDDRLGSGRRGRLGADGRVRRVPQKAPEAAWRSKPLKDVLDVADYVWAALKLWKLGTAGDLFAALAGGATLGLQETTLRDLMDRLKELDGFDGRLQEGAGGRGPGPGSEQFNWRHFDGPYGAAVRAVDAVAERHPAEKDSAEFQGLMRLFSEVRALWDSWHKKLTKKKEAA